MYDIFTMKDFKMPKGFLWGSSTAGHQIEGGDVNAGRSDINIDMNKATEDYVPAGKACNHYELYKEDAELVKQLGHRAYRMSVEWSRIEPSEGEFNKDALEHYLDELSVLKEKGIKIFLTLVHFTVPKWFADLGGFKKMENYKYFERYIDFIVPKISEFVDFWNIFNETNHHNRPDDYRINSLIYHAYTYHRIKKYSNAPISTAHAFHYYMPKRGYDRFDSVMAEYYDVINNEYVFHAVETGEIVLPGNEGVNCPELKNAMDFWAINYYTRDLIDARNPAFLSDKYNHTNLNLINKKIYFDEFFAEGMMRTLMRLRGKPVYITENGCCCDDDRFRIVYIATILSSLRDAIDFGVDVRGYLYWSLMDNYEWGSFEPRFGLVNCDFKTFKRTPKPSAWFYKEIIENNGFSQEILRKYLKNIPSMGIFDTL